MYVAYKRDLSTVIILPNVLHSSIKNDQLRNVLLYVLQLITAAKCMKC